MVARQLQRLLASASLALVLICLMALPALAGRAWCAKDPIVQINGQDVQLFVAIPEELQYLVTGPIDVDIDVPEGMTSKVLFLDTGFNGYGETVSFGTLKDKDGVVAADGSFTIQVRVRVPIDVKKAKSVPLRLIVNTGGVANEVTAGQWTYTRGSSNMVETDNRGAILTIVVPASR